MISNHMSPFLPMIAWEFAQLSTLVKMGTNDWLSVNPRLTRVLQVRVLLVLVLLVQSSAENTVCRGGP